MNHRTSKTGRRREATLAALAFLVKLPLLGLLLLAVLTGCERYPSQLSPADQVQALLYEHMASQVFGKSSGRDGDDDLLLFLCYGMPHTTPAEAVEDYVAKSFRSVRPCSSVEPSVYGPVKENVTGRLGMKLIIEPFTMNGNAPLTVQAGTYVDGKHARGWEYRLEFVQGRWKIVSRQETWIS